MDYFTKRPEVYAISYQEAFAATDALVTKFFCRFGVPMELHSDPGRNFESRLIQDVLERLGCQKKLEQHPYTCSQVEWWNAALRRSTST
jgi:hypothetical protein